MASEEHKVLAQFLKEVHSCIRKESLKVGDKQAWQDHCENKDVLLTYAQCMEKLATTHWEYSSANPLSAATSRIKWAADVCFDYFVNKSFLHYRQKEIEIASKISIKIEQTETFSQPVKLIDVGSCFNPFTIYDYLDVFAIDLCPANSSVLECDFLNVSIGTSTIIVDKTKVKQFQLCSFDVVTFCFLLEYIPSSELRIKACEKAYSVLKPSGLLIISTPDSKHVGANAKLMKCWRYTLANLGFIRIKYEKFKHMHCMAFRKAFYKGTAERWARIHREPYMEHAMHIPQDFYSNCEEESTSTNTGVPFEPEDFKELPFHVLNLN